MLAEPNQIKWRDILIDQHMSMAWRVASSMRRKLSAASKLGQGPDDLYGSAMLGLVQGVEWVRAGRLCDNGVTGYLYVTIKRFVTDYCEADHLVPIERRALKDYYDSHGASGMAVGLVDDRTVVSDPAANLVADETLTALNAQEPIIVGMLVNGLNQGQIAETLGVDRTTVCRRIARMARYVD